MTRSKSSLGMFTATMMFCFGSALAFAGGDPAAAKSADTGKGGLALPKCPVMGQTIDLSVFTNTDDGPVYFCCKGCISKYEADKAKYADAVADQRKALAALPKVQVKCPVMAKPVDEKYFVEQDGGKIYFCCNGCPSKFKKDPAKYKAGVAASYTHQTKCPVTSSSISPKSSATLVSGQSIYFSSDDAKKSFLEKPDQFVANLLAQGVRVDPAKAKEESGE